MISGKYEGTRLCLGPQGPPWGTLLRCSKGLLARIGAGFPPLCRPGYLDYGPRSYPALRDYPLDNLGYRMAAAMVALGYRQYAVQYADYPR